MLKMSYICNKYGNLPFLIVYELLLTLCSLCFICDEFDTTYPNCLEKRTNWFLPYDKINFIACKVYTFKEENTEFKIFLDSKDLILILICK